MKNIGLFEIIINRFAQQFLLLSLVGLTLISSPSYISRDKTLAVTSEVLEISFNDFSPAFAAFEDEFLFQQNIQHTTSLEANLSSQTFNDLLKSKDQPSPVVTHIEEVNPKRMEPIDTLSFLDQFDGEKSISTTKNTSAKNLMAISKEISISQKRVKRKNVLSSDELSFGSLVAMVSGPKVSPSIRLANQPKITNQPEPSKAIDSPPSEVEEKGPIKEVPKTYETFSVGGGLELKQGLAFLGSMEVSWVVGDYELQVGSINAPDATYEIEVNQLVGDIIVSLYDNKDELIGEGFIDLSSAKVVNGIIKSNIQVFPVDWDAAGQVIHSDSLSSAGNKPIEGVEIALYAFNDATQSSADGRFSFYNWKKSNSRTLAIASKEGFTDSIFMMDSKMDTQVVLFKNTYLDAFYEYLSELGIYDVKEMGTVYGQIQGVEKASGYSVKLEKSQPIYFMDVGFATTDQRVTSKNGLFSFVGLQDGDYELLVEKEGEVIDQRILVVEQGKISPVLVDLSKISKHIEFFDPMEPERKLTKVEVSFFDGSTQKTLDHANQFRKTMNSGQDLSLMEYASPTEINRTLISRNKGLQKIPLLQDAKIFALAEQSGLKLEEGLIFGFVDSLEPFSVSLAEEAVQTVLYFDSNGNVLKDPESLAHGFIISGFSQGLSSLILERQSDHLILGTDLIYSDHNSISVTHLEILNPN